MLQPGLRQPEDADEECLICAGRLLDLGGAIDLPCRCHLSYCSRCWDRSLATSIANTGVCKCPTCKCSVRVDFDAEQGRLLFSKIAELSIPFKELWQVELAEKLRMHGLTSADEDTKFAITDYRGAPARVWSRISVSATWEKMQHFRGPLGFLHKYKESIQERSGQVGITAEELAEGPSIKDFRGNEIAADRIMQQHCPVVVKYPKHVDTSVKYHALDQLRFPLTLTLKEYAITIDNTCGLPSLRCAFGAAPTIPLILRNCDLTSLSQWKDQESRVQLHPGDWIIEVNGIHADAEQMVQTLEKKDVLKMRVQQSAGIIAHGVYESENETRKRLSEQTKPRQLALLRQYGDHLDGVTSPDGTARLMCVCGGALTQLPLRERVHLLVEPKGEGGVLKHGGQVYTVDRLIQQGAITCDLCQKPVTADGLLWMCENGDNTILHAHSYDICDQCLKNATGARERDQRLIQEQDAEFKESLRIDEERARAERESRAAAEQERLSAQRSAAELQNRQEAFERLHSAPAEDEPHVSVRFRATDGYDLERRFSSTATISALFEFVAVATWRVPLPTEFDLQTAYPKRSLSDCKDTCLQAAELGSPVLLRIVGL